MTNRMRWSTAGLESAGDGVLHRTLACVDCVLRGVGQVMFQNHGLAGLLFLLGIAANSRLFALAALAGSGIATLTGWLLRVDRALLRAGMFGFNGALVAIALLYFLQPDALTWACVLLAAAASTVLMAAMLEALAACRMPALTAPFVFTSLVVFLAATRFPRLVPSGQLPTAGLPVRTAVEGVVTAQTVADGVLNGVSQVFFQHNLLTGLLFAVGLLIASRRACIAALAGSLVGLVVAWAMGAAEPGIHAGAFGFNSVLTAVALAAVLLPPGRASFAYAMAGAAATPFVAAACAVALAPFGLPAMTLPFVLTTWVFLLASRRFTVLAQAPPAP